MLAEIRQYINNLPNISFEEYYQQYILDIQDNNLESEKKKITFNSIDKILAKIERELAR